MLRALAGALILVAATATAVSGAAADDVDVQLVGFLAQLKSQDGGATLAELEVPNEQGGPRVTFQIEITPSTSIGLLGGRLRTGELVVLDGLLAARRVRARRVADVRIVELAGRFLLGEGSLALPVSSDRLVQVAVDGSTAPLTFLLLRGAGVARVRDGQPVTLGVVNGTRLIVGVEAR